MATDTFNRADESPLAGNWSNVPGAGSGCYLITNAAAGYAVSVGASYWNAATFANDQYSQTKITNTTDDGGWRGAACRCRTATQFDAYHLLEIASGSNSIYKWINGTATLLSTLNFTFAANDTLKIDASGTTITAYKNGTSQGSTTDASIASGAAGIIGNTWSNWMDDWEGGDIAAAAFTPLVGERFSLAGSRGLA